MKTLKPNATHLALALILIGLRPAFAAGPATGAARAEAVAAETASAERKAALASVDAQIDRIEAALDHAPDAAEQNAARARLAALKERRSELRKHYARARVEELQTDARIEYEKVAAWTRKTTRDLKEKIADADAPVDASSAAQAAANPEASAASAQLGLYRMDPSPENKAEVQAALAALDAEIDRLEEHAGALPPGENRRALEKRIKALEKRENALQRDFTKARWDALVRDVKTEWDQALH